MTNTDPTEATPATEGEIVAQAGAGAPTETATAPAAPERATAPKPTPRAPKEPKEPKAPKAPRARKPSANAGAAPGMLRVRNLSSWAGLNFSYAPGEELELEESVARGRAAAGLVEIL